LAWGNVSYTVANDGQSVILDDERYWALLTLLAGVVRACERGEEQLEWHEIERGRRKKRLRGDDIWARRLGTC